MMSAFHPPPTSGAAIAGAISLVPSRGPDSVNAKSNLLPNCEPFHVTRKSEGADPLSYEQVDLIAMLAFDSQRRLPKLPVAQHVSLTPTKGLRSAKGLATARSAHLSGVRFPPIAEMAEAAHVLCRLQRRTGSLTFSRCN
jgi:hypothetical protein